MANVDAESDPLIGHVLDERYQLEQRIGSGGMGAVYRGRHLLMDRKVALKVLRPDMAHDANAARRFAREAKSAFRFDHPNCVRVSDFGNTADGLVYLVMELLDGRTIGDELHYDGAMSGSRVAHIARQVCNALDHAHSLGLIHRDLKPDNIMLLKRGQDADFVKVLDFGLAKLFQGPDAAGSAMFSMAALTQQGTIYGTPEYMSPEQATGQTLDPRSDIYALGVVMYEMVSGMLPFQGGTYMATLTAHVKKTAIPPAERRPDLGIAPELDQLIMRCLSKAVDERPSSAAEMSALLAALEPSLRVAPARVPRAVAASATLDLSGNEIARAEIARAAIASSETVGIAPATPTASASALTTNKWALDAKKRGRVWRVVGLCGAVVVAGIIAVVALSGSEGREAANALATADAAPPMQIWDASPPHVDATAAAAAIDAGPAKPGKRPTPSGKSARRKRLDAHLRAASTARRAGRTLKQIAEADQALRLSRGNLRAAFLLGDGLLRSGDKRNGCKYLKRARRLRSARNRAQAAGCPK